MKDKLFLLKPGYLNVDVGPLYCSDSVPVEGMLSFFPELRNLLEVQYLGFPRPRTALVALLGEERQSLPVLVIDRDRKLKAGAPEPDTSAATRFLNDERKIRQYLSAQYGFPVAST
jgi:Protein of unknown function (DUF3088)